jgi:membrane-associated phospholipid phosphatase
MSLTEIDKFLFFFINLDLQNSFFDIFMPFLTKRSYFFFLPFFVWLIYKDKKKALAVFAIAFSALLLSDWNANMLKHYFERPRPCNELTGVRMLVGCRESFSMPSSHAVNAFAFATPFVIMIKSRVRYVFPVIAVLVGFSRVYVGVHYPSDVFAGAMFGCILAICMIGFFHLSSKRFQEKPYTTALFVFFLAVGLFRIYYILNSPVDLSPDEAHYWEWSRRPDLSYYSKGPMIAYLICIGTSIFGHTVFGVRIMAVVFSLLSGIFLFMLGKKLFNEKVGLFSAMLIQIIPLFSTYGIIFTIDSPFIFFWILSLYLFRQTLSGNESSLIYRPSSVSYWVLLGVSIGLGLLTKYTMAFFYVCAFFFFIFSKEHRNMLFTKGPYIGFIVSLIIFSPVILWNADHDWVTIRHTAGQAHVAEGFRLSITSLTEFLGSQLGVITPLLFILIAVSVWKLRKKREGMFLFWFSIPVITFFVLKSLQAKVQANWAMPGYITGVIAFSVFYLKELNPVRTWRTIVISAAVLLALSATAAAHYPSALNLPVKLNPAARLYGWKDLGTEVSKVYEEMSSRGPVFIFSDKYQVASELAFYVKGLPVTYCINLNRRMNQYDLWPGFQDMIHYDAVFVRTGDASIPDIVAEAFHKVEKKVITVYTKKRVKIRDFTLFLCYDFKGMGERKPETY